MTDTPAAPARLVASHLRDFAEFLPVEKREDFNATIDDLVDRLATAHEANTALDRALRSDTAPLSPKSENSRDNAESRQIGDSIPTAARCVSVPMDTWDNFIKDYNRYVDGDLKMPFSLLRDSLAALIEDAAPVAADTKRNDILEEAATAAEKKSTYDPPEDVDDAEYWRGYAKGREEAGTEIRTLKRRGERN